MRYSAFPFFFNQLEHLFGVAFGLDVLEDMDEFAVGADEECGARDAGDGLAVHRLVAQKIEALDEHLVGVGEQRILDVVFFGELLLRLYGVAGDAEDDGSSLLQLCELITKAAGFDGAAGRVGARDRRRE